MTSTRFNELFHLLEILHSFLATKLFHRLDFMVPKVRFAALFHEPLHFSKIGFSTFFTTLFHHLVHHRYSPRLGTSPTPDYLPQHGYGDIDLDQVYFFLVREILLSRPTGSSELPRRSAGAATVQHATPEGLNRPGNPGDSNL